MQIQKHKTAITRKKISRPISWAIEDVVITKETTVFDYGCGKGSDVEFLISEGYTASGYDPHFFPDNPKIASDVVNLGYVLNVIPSVEERTQVLKDAWSICKEVMVVSVQSIDDAPPRLGIIHGDGHITKINTFQKYYLPGELKEFVDSVLGTNCKVASQNTVYVWRK